MKTKTDLVFFTRIQIRSYLTHLSALHKSFHLHGTTNLSHVIILIGGRVFSSSFPYLQLVQAHDNMTDFAKVFNIYPIGSDQEDIHDTEHIKRANASKIFRFYIVGLISSPLGVNQDFSKTYVRITIKIPQMRTGLNWRKFIREPKNGLISKATYHGTYVTIDFTLVIIICSL